MLEVQPDGYVLVVVEVVDVTGVVVVVVVEDVVLTVLVLKLRAVIVFDPTIPSAVKPLEL